MTCGCGHCGDDAHDDENFSTKNKVRGHMGVEPDDRKEMLLRAKPTPKPEEEYESRMHALEKKLRK